MTFESHGNVFIGWTSMSSSCANRVDKALDSPSLACVKCEGAVYALVFECCARKTISSPLSIIRRVYFLGHLESL